MKTRRGQRYEILRANGFLPFEARPLSRVPIRTVPYMGSFIRERQDLFRRAQRGKVTQDQWRSKIRELYIINDLMKTNWKGKKVADPWKFLRDFEDRYRARNPAYESPWEKRRRTWVNFMARIEKTIAKQGLRQEQAQRLREA